MKTTSYTLLENGTVVNADGEEQANVLIRERKIVQVSPKLTIPVDTTVIDCSGKYILPGIIDSHTHMGIPIKNGWSADDFDSGTRAALKAGVTTILDFTILEPGQSLTESVAKRLKQAEKSHITVGLHCNITRYEKSLLKEIPDLIRQGIRSFKAFTTYEEAGMYLTYAQIKKVARIIGKHGGLLMVHAEDNETIKAATKQYSGQNLTHPKYHALSRPPEAERLAVEKLVEIHQQTGCPIYIVHLNTAAGLEIAKAGGLLVETCPQYLFFNDSVYEQPDGRMYVISPPLRKPSDQKALWEGLLNGQVDTIGTDHCPFRLSDKPEGLPFEQIPNGMGGIETAFPIMLAKWLKEGWPLSRLVQLMSSHAARIFGLYPQKGVIQAGSDADVVIFDPDNRQTITQQDLAGRDAWNGYLGLEAVWPG
ncbi:MAG: amidohydrolase family protein [Lentisphaeria bacterium]|nr:amidohydrolase family protein [Candidatus Neomarinimicrobiota bacterium]MCF7841477.1 amidohydrolase family protein [Lentisphaeria bacterium]